MGSIYRRKMADPTTGQRVEIGPYWIKYYRNGRPFRESTGHLDKAEARRRLKQREGEVAEGRFRGLQIERIRFEALAADLRADYQVNKNKTLKRLDQLLAHLNKAFSRCRAAEITTGRVKDYITARQAEGAANATINRELGALKRMFSLASKQTPRKVGEVPHIPQLTESNVRSGFLEHEDFLALRGALPDYAQVAVTLAYYSGMRMGEVFSLQWSQVNWTEGKLFLKAQDTKTNTPRVLYLTGDLYRVLDAWRRRCAEKWRGCPWICHRGGIRMQSLRHSWKKGCERVGLGHMVLEEAKGRKVWQGKIPHDCRRTAVRNMIRAGVPEKVAMAISGHKTRSVFDRYNIVNETDLKAAAVRLSDYFSEQMGTISGTIAKFQLDENIRTGV